jgi:hypothetical protein
MFGMIGSVDDLVSADCDDRAARDGTGQLATMPLSVGRYLRSLTAEQCRELGQWLLQRAEQPKREP